MAANFVLSTIAVDRLQVRDKTFIGQDRSDSYFGQSRTS
jgi:hypothetical protein